jgi:hypothetical protein
MGFRTADSLRAKDGAKALIPQLWMKKQLLKEFSLNDKIAIL